jgi:ATP/ADP translocase
MVFLIFIAFMLILYGVMCFLAREALWRLSVPAQAQSRVNRATYLAISLFHP